MSKCRATWCSTVMISAIALLSACAPQTPPPPPQAQAPMAPTPPQPVSYWISFPTNSTVLHTSDQETILAVASKMRNDPALFASIVGKTDTVGTPDYNRQLSEKRAVAVFESLVYKHQVPENRVDMSFTGEQHPNVPTEDQQAELQNRVVMITLHYR